MHVAADSDLSLSGHPRTAPVSPVRYVSIFKDKSNYNFLYSALLILPVYSFIYHPCSGIKFLNLYAMSHVLIVSMRSPLSLQVLKTTQGKHRSTLRIRGWILHRVFTLLLIFIYAR